MYTVSVPLMPPLTPEWYTNVRRAATHCTMAELIKERYGDEIIVTYLHVMSPYRIFEFKSEADAIAFILQWK